MLEPAKFALRAVSCVSVFLFSPVCVSFLVFRLIATESSALKIVCPDQIYCKWGRAPPRAPGILSPLPLILYFIKCVFCSGSGGEGDGLCNVAPSAYYHPGSRIHASPRAWLAGSEQPRRLQDKQAQKLL